MATFINPFSYIVNPNSGLPLVNGKLYFGHINSTVLDDPVNIKIANTDINLPQPVRTSTGGIATYQGHPVQIEVMADSYNVLILDEDDNRLFQGNDLNIAIPNEVSEMILNNLTQAQYPDYLALDNQYRRGSRVRLRGYNYQATATPAQLSPLEVNAPWIRVDYQGLLESVSDLELNTPGEICEFSVTNLPDDWILLNGQRIIDGVRKYPALTTGTQFPKSISSLVVVRGNKDLEIKNIMEDPEHDSGLLGSNIPGTGKGLFLEASGSNIRARAHHSQLALHAHHLVNFTSIFGRDFLVERHLTIGAVFTPFTDGMVQTDRISNEEAPNNYPVLLAIYAGRSVA